MYFFVLPFFCFMLLWRDSGVTGRETKKKTHLRLCVHNSHHRQLNMLLFEVEEHTEAGFTSEDRTWDEFLRRALSPQ